MLISGTGIPSNFYVKIKPGFTPETVYAMQWTQLSSGNWVCIDRGARQDSYECMVNFYSTEQTEINGPSINEIINAFEANRVAGVNYVVLSSFNSSEHIFGADVRYTGTITATAIIDRRTQNTWKGWGLPVRLVIPSSGFGATLGNFTGSPALPYLRCIDVGVDADADRTINKIRAYDGTTYYEDHVSDIAFFTGVFTFMDSEMISLRRYVATQRGATISIPAISGIQYAWGRRTTAFPLSAKIIKFEDMGMLGVSRWKAKITFAEKV